MDGLFGNGQVGGENDRAVQTGRVAEDTEADREIDR